MRANIADMGFSSDTRAQEVSKCAKTLHHCISRHHISQVGHLGGLFTGSAGTDLLWIGEVFRCIMWRVVRVLTTMTICSCTLNDYRNGFYGAVLAQCGASLPRSTLIRRQNEVTCK